MKAIEISKPVSIHNRVVGSIAAESSVLSLLNVSIAQLRDYLLPKLFESKLATPIDAEGNEVEVPYLQRKEDFYYELDNIELPAGDFVLLVKLAVESVRADQRSYPGSVLHVLSAQLKLKDV